MKAKGLETAAFKRVEIAGLEVRYADLKSADDERFPACRAPRNLGEGHERRVAWQVVEGRVLPAVWALSRCPTVCSGAVDAG